MLAAIYKLLLSIFGLSTETDPEGNKILKVVDAAPFAYDPVLGTNKVSLVASKKLISSGNIGSLTPETIAVDGKKTYILSPPPGKIWRIIYAFIMIPAPSGSPTTGTHQIFVRYATDSSFNVLRGVTAFNKIIQYNYGTWSSTVDTKEPTDERIQYVALKDLLITSGVPLYFVYENKTDVTITVKPEIRIFYTEEDEI